MKFLLVLAATVFAVSALTQREAFTKWQTEFGKTYATAAAEQAAFAAFELNTARIARENSNARAAGFNTVFAHNKFSDISPKQFAKQFLNGYTPQSFSVAGASPVLIDTANARDIPDSFSWVEQKKTTAVKDQAQCGSCWAFSATEGIESAWLMANHTEVILSPQQIVSCDTVDQGCNGGDLPTAFAYVKEKGLEDEADYPYTSGQGNTGVCKYKEADVKVHISGFKYAVNDGRKNDTVLAVASYANGPLSICVDASSWQNYQSGILKRGCGTSLDHCVQLVGWGVQSSVQYWIVRNSWNTDWGLNGYIWIERNSGKDLCGITEEATWVTL